MTDQERQYDEGVKFDGDKLRWDLLPWTSLEHVARAYTYGAEKYEDRNWELGISFTRMFAALMRHLLAWWLRDEWLDEEMSEAGYPVPHLAAATFYLINLMWYVDNGVKCDDRPWNQPSQYGTPLGRRLLSRFHGAGDSGSKGEG